MLRFLQRLLLVPLLATGLNVAAQEKKSVPTQEIEFPPAREVQAKLREWVETRKTISAEISDWEEEKATLEELNAIRQREAEQLEEFVSAAGARVDELSNKKSAYDDEKATRVKSRRELEARIVAYEKRLRPLIRQFPPPLRKAVEEPLTRLEENAPDRPLQDRTRDVLMVSQAWLNFHRSITVDSEIWEGNGEKREVEILYLGMSRAFFVDQSGRLSGFGVPGKDGWKWTDDPSLAARVRLAIDILARRESPKFIELPIGGTPPKSE